MSAQTIRFPKPMKRGAKRKHGPCASVINFPAPLTGEALALQWHHLLGAVTNWSIEDVEPPTTGEERAHLDFSVEIGRTLRMAGMLNGTDDPEGQMRDQVDEWRGLVRKRNGAKDWLKQLGAQWEHLRTPEQALLFVFDRLSQPSLPASA